jgi:hypothetical protein
MGCFVWPVTHVSKTQRAARDTKLPPPARGDAMGLAPEHNAAWILARPWCQRDRRLHGHTSPDARPGLDEDPCMRWRS